MSSWDENQHASSVDCDQLRGSKLRTPSAYISGRADRIFTGDPHVSWPIGQVDSFHIVDWPSGVRATDTNPKGDLELAAIQVPAPGISENFMAPVNGVCSSKLLRY